MKIVMKNIYEKKNEVKFFTSFARILRTYQESGKYKSMQHNIVCQRFVIISIPHAVLLRIVHFGSSSVYLKISSKFIVKEIIQKDLRTKTKQA